MKELMLVTAREIVVRGRTKSYLVGLFISGLFVAVAVMLPTLFDDPDNYRVGVVASSLSSVADTIETTTYPDRATAESALRAGDVEALVIDNTTIVTTDGVDLELQILLQQAHQAAQLEAAGVTLTALEVQSIAGTDPAQTGLATLIVIVLFMLIMFTSMYVAIGVVEEKSSRIVEILLSSLRPWQLLGGKIIGLTVLSLANLVVIAAAGLVAVAVSGDGPQVPGGMAGVASSSLVWFLLGCVFFAALSAMFASLVSRQEDLNTVLTPMILVLTATYLLSFFVAAEPQSTVAQIFSVLPPFSAMVMPVRFAAGGVPLWQFGVSALLMILASAGMVWLAARIYQRAVLRTGARLKLSAIWR